MGKRQIEALKTKVKLIEAAKQLINEKGSGNVTVDDIVGKAGVAKGTFYVYFKKKEDIVAEIGLSNFNAIYEKTKKFDGDVCKQICEFLVNSMEYIVQTGLNMAQMWFRNVVNPEVSNDGQTKLEYDLKIIKEIFEAAVASGELRRDTPIDILQEMIVYEYYGAVVCWCITEGKNNPIEIIKDYCDIQLSRAIDFYK